MGDIEFDRELFDLTLRDIDALEQPTSNAPDARFAFLMYLEDLRDRVAAYRVAATLMGNQELLDQIRAADETLARAATIPEPPLPPPQSPDPPRRPWAPVRPVTPFSAPSVPPSPTEQRAPSIQRGRRVRLDVYDTGSQPSLASVSVTSRAPSVASSSGATAYPPRLRRHRGRSSSRSSDVSTTAVAYFPMRDEPAQFPRPLIQCAACFEDIDGGEVVTPCSHHYHRGCMAGLFEAAVTDDWLFPPKCCGQRIDVDTVLDALPRDVRRRSLSRLSEIENLLRVYCPCGAVLGMQHDLPPFVTCVECAAVVCASCRSAHPEDLTCAQHEDALPIVDMANTHSWRRCPGCRSYVERTDGCPHMTCRCSTQFCYLCAALWKTCPC
ncbi:hypothetical protein AURDEDRAFT_157868 [Auricularia subglabra TFB-10046 SS5]|nr:hypothetical protein AURDEDRAFT_157868 [Auricularia subglabra TFB-10046 SS5]